MKSKLLIIAGCLFVLLLFGCSDKQVYEGSDVIELTLHHEHADNVLLVYTIGDKIDEIPMDKTAMNHFMLNFDLPQDKPIMFNFKVTSNDYPDAVLWVGKANGIDAYEIKINDETITGDFLVKTQSDPAAAFSILFADSSISFGGGEQWNPDPKMPPELPQYHEYCAMHLPPEGFSASLPWFQTLHIYGEDEESLVEIDYIRFYAHLPSGDVLLYEETYDTDFVTSSYGHGGLYLRYPFFYNEQGSLSMPVKAEDGLMIITPKVHEDKVYHWWAAQRSSVPHDAQYLRLEAKMRITGPACVQAGIDFWRDLDAPYEGLDVNNTEGGASNVFFDDGSGDWQIIEFSTKDIAEWNK